MLPRSFLGALSDPSLGAGIVYLTAMLPTLLPSTVSCSLLAVPLLPTLQVTSPPLECPALAAASFSSPIFFGTLWRDGPGPA